MKLGVCIVTICFYPDVGGIQMYVLALAQHLQKMGVDAFVITRLTQDVPLYEEVGGLPVYRLDIPRETPKAKAALQFTAGALKLMKQQQDRFQIIHSHQVVSPTTIGLIGRELFHKKLVVTPHTPTTSGAFHSLVYRRPFTGKPRLWWMKKRIDALVSISKEIQDDLLRLGFSNSKISLVPNGVDTNRFAPISALDKQTKKQSLNLNTDPTLVYVGRLIPRKQVDILIRAFAALTPNLPASSQLVILGDGEERSKLENLALELNIAEQVKFVGAALDVENYLQASDIFILPSSSEGMPIALLEAMASGLPCVGSAIGGILDVIEPNVNGMVAPSGDIVALQNVLEQIISNPDMAEKLGIQARNDICQKYSIQAAAETHFKLYRNLLATPSV